MKQIELVSIDQSGVLSRSSVELPEIARKNCIDTAAYYKIVGFVPPWIGYVTVYEGTLSVEERLREPLEKRELKSLITLFLSLRASVLQPLLLAS